MKSYRNPIVAAAAIFGAGGAIVVPALATPSSGFTRAELSTGVLDEVNTRGENDDKWEVRFRTKDESTLGLDRLTIVDGGHSGWHTHAGITMVTVIAGEVRWYDGADPGCPLKIYRVGDSFVEPANNVHLVQNISGGVAEFTAVQVRPRDAAGRIDAAQPAACPTF